VPLERGRPPRKAIVRVVVGLVIVSQVSALLGDLALAEFVDKRPAWLIALNPRNRNLALATNQLDAVTYYTIGFARLVASDPLYYLLGFWYGDRALAWIERRSRTYGPFVREGESFFRKASYPLIFAAPNNIVCALSAATGVKLRTFIALNLSGTVARLILIRQLGEVLESPIQTVIDFIARYRTPVLIVSAIAVAWTIFGEFRGDNSELKMLNQLASDDATDNDGSPRSGSDQELVQADGEAGEIADTADGQHHAGHE
jgi:membrane protein DedA with SNARE-associated domain